MTKYILNSGGFKNHPERAKQFFTEVFKGLGSSPRLLMCFFAYERQDGEQKFKEEQAEIQQLFPADINPVLELARIETFEVQVEGNNVIFLRGGDDHLLIHELQTFDIPKIFQGKVVATSSAGSDAMARYFWDIDRREPKDAMGVLPIKFLPHYESSYGNGDPRGPIDWKKVYGELERYGDPTLPIHALREGEYVVINQ